MGIVEGLFAGRAGIESHGTAISVLADNISNTNTVGYKASRADFADLVAGSISGSGASATVGSGSQIAKVTQIFNQGSFEFTGRGLDLAIDGDGFFVVSDGTQNLYTRAGNFRVDAAGNLLDQNGNNVMGFPAGGAGTLEVLNVNDITNASVSTSDVTVVGNLNAGADVSADATPTLQTASSGAITGDTYGDLSDNAQFSTFFDVFDSLGGRHTVTAYFFKASSNTWNIYGVVDGSEVTATGAADGEPFQIFSMTDVDFDTSGSLATGEPTSTTATAVPWANGSAAHTFDVEIGNFTQFAAASAINTIDQDGSGGGNVVSFAVDESGTLSALLNNGQTSEIGVVAIAKFANAEGLARKGGSLFAQTNLSGAPVVGTPGTGQFGSVQAGALELSTADLADDFIKLIQIQRGFQGSSRVIGRIDDLLNEVIGLA